MTQAEMRFRVEERSLPKSWQHFPTSMSTSVLLTLSPSLVQAERSFEMGMDLHP